MLAYNIEQVFQVFGKIDMEKPVYQVGKVRDHIHYDDADWCCLQQFWNDLPIDNYMGDHGKYRRRRYSSITYNRSSGTIRIVGDNKFQQSKKINPLNGDVVRSFEPVQRSLLRNATVVQLIEYFAPASAPNFDEYRINIHQHRITATEAEHGKPTPEGIHRDGVGHIVMLLVAKVNVQGGISTLYDNNRQPVFTHTLAEPGDYIFLADHTCLHSASQVYVTPPFSCGYRDMLFFEFF
jgi:hypothetical protein